MRMGKNKSAKLEATHSRALASQSDEEEEDDTLLQCIMCNCTTIEDYLKRHIRYNHLICKDDIIEKLYKLHYPPENCTISTQTDVTWVHGDKHKKEKYVEQEEQEYYSDGGGMEDAVEDHGMDNGQSDEEEVLCPACGDVEDGTPMIACDLCDRWYHWVCVGITATPTKGQEWVCNGCGKDSDHLGKRAIKTSVEEDEIMDVKKIKEEFSRGRMSNRSASRASRDDDIKVTAVVRPRRGDFDPGSPSHESTPKTKKKSSSPVNERSTKQKKVQSSPVLALPEPEVPKRGKAKFKYASRRYKADLSPETTEDESEISPDDDPDFDAQNEHIDKDDMNLYIRSKKSGGKSKPKGKIRRKSSLDESNIDDMSRDELREMCKKECLKGTGSRDELLTRLQKSRNISNNRNSKTQKRDNERQLAKEKEKKKLNSTKHTLVEITEGDGTDDDFCKICFLGADLPEDLELGPLYKYGVCQAHLHCLMFSSGLIQTGEDDEGIHGFMPDEIVAEWRRGGKLKCSYCKEIYATVGCSVRTCLKTYHLPCGIKNGALHEYYGNFDSYCSVHRNTRPNRNKHKKEYVLTDVGLVPSWVDEEGKENDDGKKTQVKSKKKPQKKEDEDDEEDEDESLNSSKKSKKLSRKRETKKQEDESKTSEEDEDVDRKSRVTKRRRRIHESDEGKRITSEEEEDTETVSKQNTRKKRKSNDENYKKSSEEEDESFSSSKKSKGNKSHTNKNIVKSNESDNKISEDEGNNSKANRGSKRKTKFQKKRNRIVKDDDDSDIKPNSSDEEDNKNEAKNRYTKSRSEDEKDTLWETVGNKSGKGKHKEKERKTKSSSEDEDISSKSKLRSMRRRRVSDICKQKSSSEEEGTALKSRTRNTRKRYGSNGNKNKIASDGENNKENSNEDDEEKNKEREKEKEKESLWKSMALKSKYPNDKDEHSDDDVKHSEDNEEKENITKKKGNKTISEETGTTKKAILKETSEINDFVSDNDDTLGFDPPDESDNEEDPKKTNIRGRKKQGKVETYQESDKEDADSKESLFDQIKNPKRKKSIVKDSSKTEKVKTNQDDDDVNDNQEGFEPHNESEKENKLEKKKIIKDCKDKKVKDKSKQDSENDVTPESREEEGEHDNENNEPNDTRKKNKRGKRLDVHQESEDNQFSDDDNTNRKGASTSRNSRRNGTFSTIKIVDETAETRGRPSRNCQKKSVVEDDDESDDNHRSGRKKNQANDADKFGSGVDRPSRKCSRNAIVEVEEHQDNEEKIPFRRSNRKSVNIAEDLKSNDQPSIEEKLRSIEVDSEHEEMAPLAISEDTSDEEKCKPISRKTKTKTKNTYNDTELNNKLSEEDKEAKEERRKEMEKERLWKSMAIKSKSTTSENDADLSDDRQSKDDEHSSKEEDKDKVKKKIKKKFKDKYSEAESDDETEKPSIKLRINTKTLKSKKHHGESEEDILNEETLPLNDSAESGHNFTDIHTYKENLEQNDGLNDCADLPNMSTENASVEEELSDHDGINLTKILESLNRTPENLPHHCFHFQCTLCNFNDINRDIIDDHIRVQHKKTAVKTLSKKKEMMLFIESYKLSQAEKTLVNYEMKNVNQNSGTYLKRLVEHFHFFKFVSDDMPEEIVELPDRLSEYCNSDAQSITSSESSESKACRRISKRPLKDKDFVDWNEVNPKKLRKDPAQSTMSDEDNVSVDSETTARLKMSNLTQERTTRNKKRQSEPEEDSPIPQNDTTSPLPMSSLRNSSVSQNSKWTSHSPRSGSHTSNEDDKRAGSLSPSANSPTQCFQCLKCGTKIKLAEDLVIKHLNRHKMTLKDYIEFYHAEGEIPLQWQEEDSFNHASKCQYICSICDETFKNEELLKDHMSSHNEPEEKKNQETSFKGFVDETCLVEDDICSKSKIDEKIQECSQFETPSKAEKGTCEPVQQCFSPGRRIAEIPDTEEFSDIYMAKYTDENGHERIWVEEFNADGMPGLYVNGKATGSVDVAEIRKAIELKANIPERFEKMVFMIKPKGSPQSEYKSNKDLLQEMDRAEEKRKPKIILKLPRPAKNNL